MVTYQDLQKVLDGEDKIPVIDFVKSTIAKHKDSVIYQTALVADEYNRKLNRTIVQYQKFLYTAAGQAVPDMYASNYKLRSNFFNRFVTQQNQFLLGNGVKWEKEDTADKLGGDFDSKLQDAGEKALVHAVSFGFWNMDHLQVFSLLEFCPLWDEEDGSMKAGIRFWQIDDQHPLRATLYEMDGYTEYIWRKGKAGEVYQEKRSYIVKERGTNADGMEIYDGENYPGFPIVPLWGNKYHESEFVGMRENIDCYDLIKSGFASDIDEAQEIYWIIQNAGGMDDIDLAEFMERLRTRKIANVEDGQTVEGKTVEVPSAAREAMLDRLRSDMYEDYMALDTKNLASGAVTATQIEAAYEPLNEKADKYEYCILDFLADILQLAGVEDNATFTRSMVVNTTETINNVLAASQYLPQDYVTKKIMTLLGDGDQAEQALKDIDGEDIDRFGAEEVTENEDAGQSA